MLTVMQSTKFMKSILFKNTKVSSKEDSICAHISIS